MLLQPLVLLVDQILLVRGAAGVVGGTDRIEGLRLVWSALDLDTILLTDCLQIMLIDFLVAILAVVVLAIDLTKLLVPLASLGVLCAAFGVICHEDVLFAGLADQGCLGGHDLLR